jgi:hypothetical protein
MCPLDMAPRREFWSVLAQEGWLSHFVGIGIEPIYLCHSCSDHIADRRDAHRKAIEEELRAE